RTRTALPRRLSTSNKTWLASIMFKYRSALRPLVTCRVRDVGPRTCHSSRAKHYIRIFRC
ncbi:hypothetical protein COCMIDRAFT_101121, partial [Bipolaris oryzae ATCC 44560]